jgi:protease-4
MLSHQAMIQRRWAMQAIADVRELLSGAGVRADCLECRGYGAPKAVSAADQRGLMALLTSIWRG